MREITLMVEDDGTVKYVESPEYVINAHTEALAKYYGLEPSKVFAMLVNERWRSQCDRTVMLGSVQPFDKIPSTYEEIKKLGEECLEVAVAWQLYDDESDEDIQQARYDDLMEEIADVIQVVANLLASLGVKDAREIINACRERNIARNRIKR